MESNRDRPTLSRRARNHFERFFEVLRLHVEIAGAQAEFDAGGSAFDREQASAGHGGGERLRAAHAAEAGRQDPFALQRAAEMLAAHFRESFVGALHDALRADVDPRARGHLAVHHQAFAIEFVEMIPGRPMRHQIGIGDEHARRVGVRAKHADRLAGLDEQGLVGLEPAQRLHDFVESVPVARGAADAAIDHQFARPLGDVGIEIVHQHAQRRFGEPALGAQLGSARGAHDAHIVETGMQGHRKIPRRDEQRAAAIMSDGGRAGRPRSQERRSTINQDGSVMARLR